MHKCPHDPCLSGSGRKSWPSNIAFDRFGWNGHHDCRSDYMPHLKVSFLDARHSDVVTFLHLVSYPNRDAIPFLKYISIVAVFVFVIMFATGPGSIPWFLVGELFGVGARGLATSLAVAVNWSANFAVGLCFLPLTVCL